MRLLSGKALLFLGLLVFLLARLYLIVPTTAALAVPRLGDDSLVYLWKGQLALAGNADSLPALRDVAMQRHLHDGADQELRWMRSNVAQRTLGTVTPSYNLIAASALALAPDLRWAFALTELVGLALMAVGMAWFLLELAGPAVAGVALLPMAFAILPNQGIYSFIPGTLALSCSLILWAYLWRSGERARGWIVVVAALWILGLHPIAKIYVILTPALYWLRLKQWSAWKSPPMLRITLACGLTLGMVMLLPQIVPALRPPPSEIMGGLDLIGGATNNLRAVMGLAWDPIIRQNLLWALLVLGALLIAPRSTLAWPLGWLILGAAGLLGASLAFWLPGYPAELFSRIWVLFALFTSAAGARFVLAWVPRQDVSGRLLRGAFGFLLGVSALFWGIKYVPSVMNWRNEVIVEDVIRQQLAAIPSGSTLLYAETTVALQASLLLGGERLGALAYPMLAGTASLARLLEERHPPLVVLPSDTRLNSLAEGRSKRFTHRRQGLYAGTVSSFSVARNGGQSLQALSLLAEGQGEPIRWEAFDSAGNAIAQGQLPWPTSTRWQSIDVPPMAERVRFVLPNEAGWMLGLGAGTPQTGVLWPWTTGWVLSYGFRNKGADKNVHIEFSVRSLLQRFQAEPLLRYTNTADPVHSDAGGLVFLKTIY
ncbi:MAG: hypothetical protein Q8M09_03940 [Pseudomonadota bacterium]|nr:hypothetical protein [Pseudomonadota bacterium]MDP1903389.1 hypothetical protein [Pseudomonadota bacterium]MDP2352359.1 hypothetical protein [Pseudomonadota bacterium]